MSFFTSIPSKECSSPRDHQQLFKTKDIPFIGFLLSKDSDSLIHETFDPFVGYYLYSFVTPSDGAKTTSFIRRNSLTRLFKESFFGFRSALTQTGIGTCGYELKIENGPVRLPNSQMGKVLENFGKSILHPFSAQEDMLLMNLKDIPLYSWLGDTWETDRSDQLFCPLDGQPRSILKASIRTPRTQWGGFCGREWGFRICGDCLGLLGSLPVYLKQS